jgi:nucleotide-binding universal stress UspA family protein
VSENQVKEELSYELRTLMEQLPQSVRDRIDITSVEAAEPMQAVVAASESTDLTIAGASRAWGIERQTLGRYTDELAIQCRSSLLITRRYSQITSHLASVLTEINSEVTS